jgi:ABC-type transporter Mla maintaining outer membrane lipid asymmetry ATPase subunit MlaF
MPRGEQLIEVRGLVKSFHGLRPLRVEHLTLHAGESLALIGFDQATAQVFVDLVTGATLPDSGEIAVFGRRTADIRDGESWLKALDRFGLLSDRAVIVDQFTVEQNLILPFTLDLEGVSDAIRDDARRLAAEIGLSAEELAMPAAALPEPSKLRVRLGRALALNPSVFLAEHPNALLSGDHTRRFAGDLSRIIAQRGLGSIVLTADRGFAGSVADEVLELEPATGKLKPASGWRRWFS